LEIAKRLLSHRDFYLYVQSEGLIRRKYFYYPQLKERLLKIYRKYKK